MNGQLHIANMSELRWPTGLVSTPAGIRPYHSSRHCAGSRGMVRHRQGALIGRATNLTQILQLEPALKLLLQVVVSGNWCGWVPAAHHAFEIGPAAGAAASAPAT